MRRVKHILHGFPENVFGFMKNIEIRFISS